MVVIRIKMVCCIQFCAADFTAVPVPIPAGLPAVVAACFLLDMAGISGTSALMLAVFNGSPRAPVVAESGICSGKSVACADFTAFAGQVINRIVQAVCRCFQRIFSQNLLVENMRMKRSPVRVERLFYGILRHNVGCLNLCAALFFCEPAVERVAIPGQLGKIAVGTAPGYLSGVVAYRH